MASGEETAVALGCLLLPDNLDSPASEPVARASVRQVSYGPNNRLDCRRALIPCVAG